MESLDVYRQFGGSSMKERKFLRNTLAGGRSTTMHTLLNELPDLINRIFDILELIVLRSTLLGLVALGAYTVLRGWRRH